MLLAPIRHAADGDMVVAAVIAAEEGGVASADIDAAKEARVSGLSYHRIASNRLAPFLCISCVRD